MAGEFSPSCLSLRMVSPFCPARDHFQIPAAFVSPPKVVKGARAKATKINMVIVFLLGLRPALFGSGHAIHGHCLERRSFHPRFEKRRLGSARGVFWVWGGHLLPP